MQFRRPPNSDRSLESLEARLRALPQPPVPRDLESRLLAALPMRASIVTRRSVLAARPRRFVIWAGASLAVAASCLLAVRFWPKPDDQPTATTVVSDPETTDSARQLTHRQPENSRRSLPWFEARLDPDETALTTFCWPIQEKPPLLVSSALRPDLFD
jgi:anti-sigma-K factor RskA